MNKEVLEHIKEKLNKSVDFYSSLIKRKSRDLEIYSGNFWSDDTIRKYDRVGRVCSSFTQYAKFANAIVSPFSQSPYKGEIEDVNGQYVDIQKELDDIESESNFKYKISSAVRQACITGTGFLVLSFNDNKIDVELVRDNTMVVLDPSILETTAGDAEYGAVVSFMSLNRAKRLYGDDVVDYHGDCELDSITDQWTIPTDSIIRVCYYELNKDNNVDFKEIVGNKIVKDDTLPIHRIPIYRFAFNEVVRNNKMDFNGIVDMTKELMLAQSIAFSTLTERANRTPKANYMMEVSQLDGLDEFYRKLNTKESLVCLYNGEKVASPPTPITENYQTADLQATMESCGNLMAQVIGVPIGGINPAKNTATEILVQEKNSESNVESLYYNAKSAIQDITSTIVEVLCWTAGYEDSPTVKLVNGPDKITSNMKRRQELNLLSPLMTTDSDKKILAKHIVDTFDYDTKDSLLADIIANTQDVVFSNDDMSEVDAMAQAEIARLNAQVQAIQGQLDEALATAEELKNQNDELNLQLLDTKQQNILSAEKMRQDYEINSAKLQLEAAKISNETAKVEITKNNAEVDNAVKKVEALEKVKDQFV